jgi:hypothetical protein
MERVIVADKTNPKDLLGIKKTPLRLVPPALSVWTAGVMATGRSKYGELYDVWGYDGMNWRMKAVRLSVYIEAIERHTLGVKDGQWFDEEDGMPHVAHISACVAIILDAWSCGSLILDVPALGTAAEQMKLVDALLVAHKPMLDANEAKQRDLKKDETVPGYEKMNVDVKRYLAEKFGK